MLNTVKELCALSGVGGWEDEVRGYIRAHAAPYADEMRTDTLGNLIVFKRGAKATGSKLMLCAHMDEVGLIVRAVTDEGYLKFDCVGGIDRRILIGKKVLVGIKKIPGIIGIKAYHLVSEEEEKKPPKADDLYIDIGASDREEAESLVELGEPCVFDSDSEEFGDGMFKAKAIDDRLCCALFLKLMEQELPMDVTFVFSVQEEVGCRGAFGAAFALEPEIALVTDCTTAADLPDVEPGKQVCRLGEGPVIPFMDGGAVTDRTLFEQMRRVARENDIPWQTKHYVAGATDSSAIQRTKAGVRVLTVSAPIRYLHAPASVGCVKDFENMLQLLRCFIADTAANS